MCRSFSVMGSFMILMAEQKGKYFPEQTLFLQAGIIFIAKDNSSTKDTSLAKKKKKRHK